MHKLKSIIYEPPIARNLSGFLVNGQITPNAFCQNGPSVVSPGCVAGPTPTAGGSCSPTGVYAGVGGCSEGVLPQFPQPDCNTGTSALEGCSTGTHYH